jgi:hypothetical protein
MLLGQEVERKDLMAEKMTVRKARKEKAQGKAPTTQASAFVREEMHHIREGKHGARSPQQAIAIGLSKARRAGVGLPPPRTGSARTKRAAALAYALGQGPKRGRKPSIARSRAIRAALKREGRKVATTRALSRQTRKAATRRTAAARSASAKKAVRTKGPQARAAAAKKAARTRKARRMMGRGTSA